MAGSRRALRLGALALAALGLGAAGAAAQPPARELAERWLLRTCELGSEPLERALRAAPDDVARLLVAAFRSGPSPARVAAIEEAARARFALRQGALARRHGSGLSRADLERAAATTEGEFVARAREAFELGYRTQALRGVVVASPALARTLLEDASQDRTSPLREVALHLLQQLP